MIKATTRQGKQETEQEKNPPTQSACELSCYSLLHAYVYDLIRMRHTLYGIISYILILVERLCYDSSLYVYDLIRIRYNLFLEETLALLVSQVLIAVT